MFGPTNPMNRMVPTKAVAPAVSRLMRNRDRKRRRLTPTPKLRALSSPSLKAVSCHADASENGARTTNNPNSNGILSQLALVNEPRLQKMNCCSASALAKYCTMPVNALNKKTNEKHNSTKHSGPVPRNEDTACNRRNRKSEVK